MFKKFFVALASFTVIMLYNFDCHGSRTSHPDVPLEVYEEFTSSFIYENGLFRGAQVDMLRPYLSRAEIKDLVTSNANGAGTARVTVFEGRKPKPRGCKSSPNWLCIVYDVDEIRQ